MRGVLGAWCVLLAAIVRDVMCMLSGSEKPKQPRHQNRGTAVLAGKSHGTPLQVPQLGADKRRHDFCVVSGHTRRLRGSIMTSFSDLFKLGKEVLKTETFVLHEAETRGVDEGVRAFLFVFSSVFVLCFLESLVYLFTSFSPRACRRLG